MAPAAPDWKRTRNAVGREIDPKYFTLIDVDRNLAAKPNHCLEQAFLEDPDGVASIRRMQMAIRDGLLNEFDYEMANTRKTLERVPEDKFTFKPHEKSGTMIWLAGHVANIPSWPKFTLECNSLDIGGNMQPPPAPKSVKELLDSFDKNVAAGRAALAAATDAQMFETWMLKNGSQVIFSLPRVAVLRSMVMNHLIHHRGQLTVYLRLNGVPVPALYGPSADEQP